MFRWTLLATVLDHTLKAERSYWVAPDSSASLGMWPNAVSVHEAGVKALLY